MAIKKMLILSLTLLLYSTMMTATPGYAGSYIVTPLGTLGGTTSGAYGINNKGQVVGWSISTNGQRAFLYENGTMTDLGTLYGYSRATAINNNGQVVGYSATAGGGLSAFLYSNGRMIGLPPLSGVNGNYYPWGINDSGQVVGCVVLPSSGGARAFLADVTIQNEPHSGVPVPGSFFYDGKWGPAYDNYKLYLKSPLPPYGLVPLVRNVQWYLAVDTGGYQIGITSLPPEFAVPSTYDFILSYESVQMTDLGTLGTATDTQAQGINNSGQVVGFANSRAFLYSNGTMTGIGALTGNSAQAYGINNNGQVTGYSAYLTGGGSRWGTAFLYSNGKMIDLGRLGHLASKGLSININGEVVGEFYSSIWPYNIFDGAFLHSNGTMTDLTQLVSGISGVTGFHARAINDSGQIVGFGIVNGNSQAILLTPTPTDTTPDPFAFAPATGVELSTAVTSNPITVQGINAPVFISITGGSYSINDNASFTTASGTITNGSTVRIRRTSSGSYGVTTYATLNIGGVDNTFSVTTRDIIQIDDTIPDPFSFPPSTGVVPNVVVTSDPQTIQGINAPATISVTGGSYSINGNPIFTTSPGTITNGGNVKVRQTSSPSYGTTTTTTLTIGGISGTFNVTSMAAPPPVDDTADPFIFPPATGVPRNTEVTSNSITVNGINVPVVISVAGGSYSINGGTFTTEPGMVNDGDTVRVSQTSSGSYGVTTPAVLSIGSISGTFNVTTLAAAPGVVRVGYSSQWLVITFAILTLAGGYLLRRKGGI